MSIYGWSLFNHSRYLFKIYKLMYGWMWSFFSDFELYFKVTCSHFGVSYLGDHSWIYRSMNLGGEHLSMTFTYFLMSYATFLDFLFLDDHLPTVQIQYRNSPVWAMIWSIWVHLSQVCHIVNALLQYTLIFGQ